MDQRETKDLDLIDKALSILQEFYIEFFGIFLPGLIAVGSVGLMLGGLYYFIAKDWHIFSQIAQPFEGHFYLLIMVLLFVAYMVGAIEYRREPKWPDAVASLRQWRRTSLIEKERLAVSFGASQWTTFRCRTLTVLEGVLPNSQLLAAVRSFLICHFPKNKFVRGFGERVLGATETIFGFLLWLFNYAGWIRCKVVESGVNIDFPYPCLRKFLNVRRLDNLVKYVSWCDAYKGKKRQDVGKGACSKHIINTIKHCVRSSGRASLISDLTRNECHIRMLCSFWYILSFILGLSVLCLTISILIFLTEYKCGQVDHIWRVVVVKPSSLYPITLLIGCILVWWCRRNIENGFHYVRSREVVMILESACILERLGQEVYPELFSTAKTDASNFEAEFCVNCENRKMCHIEKDEHGSADGQRNSLRKEETK